MKISGWGNYPSVQADVFYFETISQIKKYLKNPGDTIVHGLGRSYGDSALNKKAIISRRFDKIIDFNPVDGIVTCESGVSLAELINAFIPKGWFLTVTPGTKFITVGGAIASDVHGKNHHKIGCFSEAVISFKLLLGNGDVVHCSRENNRGLFFATCGGMGLTGVILTAVIKLRPISSSWICESVVQCGNLEECFYLFEEHKSTTYSVAWLDCVSKGEYIGRSFFVCGDHAETGDLRPPAIKPSISIPLLFPGFFLNKYSIALFNRLYYLKNPKFVEGRLVPLDSFFYPLDAIGNWNRIYGFRGFTQYQMVLPKESSLKGIKKILNYIAESGKGSYLSVLKLLGSENDNYLSFPMEGYTLALDFKNSPSLFSLLDKLDEIVMDYEGRLYLAKDVRMARDVFIKGYPRWEMFNEIREKYGLKENFSSLQSKRLGI
jgi:decaprenylphospho-beta-D-ribofuranose 2-oxidase